MDSSGNTVLVTGGTDFVGSHTAEALAAAGYQVRLLVRSAERVRSGLPHVLGDVTDGDSVGRALDGCGAVVHAAARVTFDRRQREVVDRTNVGGARNVLGLAAARGCDPIVHVSSVAALSDEPGSLYGASKVGADRFARELQRKGSPVVITYPGGVWGPRDPNLGEQTRAVIWMMRFGMIPVTSGGFPLTDVRDLAEVHTEAIAAGKGPCEYPVSAHFLTGHELADVVRTATGRHLARVPVPGGALRGIGRLGDVVQRLLPIELPFTTEGMETFTFGRAIDSSSTERELGIRFRPPEETVADTVRWLRDEGHLTRRQTGTLI